MREYGQVQCSFWSDPDIQGTTETAKLLALYLLTGPHSNGLGCYRLPNGYVQADFGWSSERVSKGYGELFQIGFCNRCESTDFVLIPKFMRWNPVANPKVAIAREKEFRTVPKKSAIYQQLAHSMLVYGGHWSEPFRNHIETVSKGYGKQDPTLPDPTGEEVGGSGDPPHPPEKPKGKTALPDGFQISEGVKAWAEKNGHRDLEAHFENFCDRARAKDYRYKDWDAALKTAIRDDWAKLNKPEEPRPPAQRYL